MKIFLFLFISVIFGNLIINEKIETINKLINSSNIDFIWGIDSENNFLHLINQQTLWLNRSKRIDENNSETFWNLYDSLFFQIILNSTKNVKIFFKKKDTNPIYETETQKWKEYFENINKIKEKYKIDNFVQNKIKKLLSKELLVKFYDAFFSTSKALLKNLEIYSKKYDENEINFINRIESLTFYLIELDFVKIIF
jgi:hypothetical protein